MNRIELLYEWLAPKLSSEERNVLDGIMDKHKELEEKNKELLECLIEVCEGFCDITSHHCQYHCNIVDCTIFKYKQIVEKSGKIK